MIFDFFETSLLTREKNCDKIIKSLNGQVSEWFKELVLKTSDPARDRGFESHPLRQDHTGERFYSYGEVLKWLKRTVC